MNKKSVLYVLTCHVLWGIFPLYWKLLKDVNPVYILANRIFWGLLFCLMVAAITKSFYQVRNAFNDKKEFLTLCLCSVLVTANWGLYIYAISTDRILVSSLAYYMNPIVAVLMGAIFFKEKLTVLQWGAVALAFGGIGISLSMGGGGSDIILALAICFTFAFYGAFKKLIKSESNTSSLIETLLMSPLALAFIIYMESIGQGSIGILSGWRYILIPLTGAVTIIPMLFFAKGIKGVPYSLAGMLMYINPTLQFLIGMLTGETIDKTKIVSFIFVWAALILYLVSGFIKSKKEVTKEVTVKSIS
ncbi:MAG: EamA family transporter RarD [Bacillota bacterium]|nr:EamA family transporter RarD [Bacillota bacterium]